MTTDPDIEAAFSGQSAGMPQSAPQVNPDPDIEAAFSQSGKPTQSLGRGPIPGIGQELLNVGKTIVGGPVHLAGTFADVASNAYHALRGEQTVSPQSPQSYANRMSAPFATPPDEALDPKQQAIKEGRVNFQLPQGPFRQTLEEYGPQALEAAQGAAGVLGFLKGRLAPSQETSTVDNPQSVSAAAATHNVSAASPELQAAVREAGPNVNQEVLGRHIEAESLPVPAKLTKGQATQDPALISMEQNARGKNPAFAERFNEQNQNLADNLQAIRESVGPDVFSTNPVEHGETLIKAYKDKAAAADADIGAKYQALRDANGGKFPIDAKSLNANVGQALHDKLLFEHAPSAEMNQLSQAADKGMTFEQYEAMRTNLARVMRSSTDGNERAAAGVIRQEMEKLPMTGDAARLKPLADSARSAAKAQFDALDADPAYKAAVNGTVSPDRFVSRFIVNGDRDNVSRMRQNFADNPAAQQTMGVAALDHLRNSARIDDLYRGNFAQASYNKNLQALDPKMSTLFSPKDAGDIRTVGNVARYQQSQPRGSFVNNSNTATTQMAENAKTALEGIANVKTGGLYGGVLKPILKGRAAKQMADEHLSVGAGLDYPAR